MPLFPIRLANFKKLKSKEHEWRLSNALWERKWIHNTQVETSGIYDIAAPTG